MRIVPVLLLGFFCATALNLEHEHVFWSTLWVQNVYGEIL